MAQALFLIHFFDQTVRRSHCKKSRGARQITFFDVPDNGFLKRFLIFL